MQRPDRIYPVDYEAPFDDVVAQDNPGFFVGFLLSTLMWVILIGIVVALTGCVAGVKPGTTAGNAQVVYQAESDYEVALQIAVAYRDLPACGSGPVICRDNAVLEKVQAANAAAWSSLLTAQRAVRAGATDPATINQAADAVRAFFALASTLKVK